MRQGIFLVLVLLLPMFVYSEHKAVRFQHITIDDGLSLSSVYCAFRDSKGYMWFGTEDGLNRYDGYHFKVFRTNVKEPNSICYKWIEHIYEDSNGHLWFGSRDGLSCYNPSTERFTNFKSSIKNKTLCNDTVTCLQQVTDSVLMVGTVNGMNLINICSHHVTAPSDIQGRINQIVVRGKNMILVGSDNGLFRYDLKSGLFTPVIKSPASIKTALIINDVLWAGGRKSIYRYHLKDNHLHAIPIKTLTENEHIETLKKDFEERIWVGTNKGLYLFGRNTMKAQRFIVTENSTNSLSINPHKPLSIDREGTLWYGTHGDGLYLIYPNLQIKRFTYNPVDKTGLSQNAINCIYNDTISGNAWLGTFGAGLNIYNPIANKFDIVKHNPLNENSLSSDFVWSICESTEGSVWIGTNDKGITRYHPETNRFEFFDHQPGNRGSLSNTSVREIFEDSKGTIWAGTDGGGLNRYNPKTKTFTSFRYSPNNKTSISDNSVRVVFEDSQHNYWVGTRNGLNRFDPSTQSFTRYMHNKSDSATISNNFVYSSIVEDRKGFLWIGTYGGGLNKMDVEKGTFTSYTAQGNAGKSLSNNIVFSIYEDRQGLIWVGTNQGLNVLNPENGSVRFYSLDDGLPNEVIYGIVPDNSGNLWLSTNRGISCFDPTNETFKNYDVHDGLQSNEFNGGAFHGGKSGRLYFGGVYGLNIIDPETLRPETNDNPVVITNLEVLGKTIGIDTLNTLPGKIHLSQNKLTLGKHISYVDEIVLDYKHRFFSLEFSDMNFLSNKNSNYKYQLYPLNNKWLDAGSRNYVSYANVKPGKYIFKVMAANAEGLWPAEATELSVIIKPPYWLSHWFIAIEIMILILVVVSAHRILIKIKLNKALRIQNKRIKHVNLKLKESENNLKDMNATKDRFFSIISHDLKNPLTSLMSISETLTRNYDLTDEEDRRMCITRINKSHQHIYSLLENLLTWSRSQRGVIEFKKTVFNLGGLIAECVNLNRVTGERKGIELKYGNETEIMAYGDRNAANTILRNLIANALKYTDQGGKVEIETSGFSETHWKIAVNDDGVGISRENIKKLFSIGQKVKTNGTAGEKGTGLGLIICKEFCDKNGGAIGVESEPGKGSTFWFTIPKAN